MQEQSHRVQYGVRLRQLASCAATMLVLAMSPVQAGELLQTIQKTKEIKIGWAEWVPFTYRDVASGEMKGLLVEIMKEVSKRIGATPTYVQDSTATLPTAVASGKADICMLGPTDVRKRIIDFTAPIYNTDFTAIVRGSSKFSNWDQLNKSENSLATTTGSAGDELLTKLQGEGKIAAQLVRIKEVGAAILAVSSGNADGYANQRDVLLLVADKQTGLRVIDGGFGDSTLAIGFPKNQPELAAEIARALKSMVADGTLVRLFDESKVKGVKPLTSF